MLISPPQPYGRLRYGDTTMANEPQSDDSTTAIQVACDTEVTGCVFSMRTEPDDKQRLLEIARDHVSEQHGAEYSLEEIEERHLREVDV